MSGNLPSPSPHARCPFQRMQGTWQAQSPATLFGFFPLSLSLRMALSYFPLPFTRIQLCLGLLILIWGGKVGVRGLENRSVLWHTQSGATLKSLRPTFLNVCSSRDREPGLISCSRGLTTMLPTEGHESTQPQVWKAGRLQGSSVQSSFAHSLGKSTPSSLSSRVSKVPSPPLGLAGTAYRSAQWQSLVYQPVPLSVHPRHLPPCLSCQGHSISVNRTEANQSRLALPSLCHLR